MKLIIVSARWAPSCFNITQIVKQIRSNYPNIKIEEFDYDFDSEKIKYYNIGQIVPIFILQDNDCVELTRIIGQKDYSDIEEILNKYNEMYLN